LGAADASLTYNTDVSAAGGKLKGIELPAKLQPTVAYGGGVVDGAPHPSAAQKYIAAVTSGACQQALRGAGFGAP
jgi:molybdate transport system substrate-binding protein